MKYEVIRSKKELENVIEYLKKVDTLFPIALSKKINIREYCIKLYEHGKIILAKIENNIVGLIAGYMNDIKYNNSYISIIVVSPKFQENRIGYKLLSIFYMLAKNSGMKKIILDVAQKNEKAISFYKKNGFNIDESVMPQYEYNIVLSKDIDNNFNILITSVGRRGYLVKYFKDIIGNTGNVCVSNSSDITPAFNYADKTVVTPLIYDKEYINFLLNYCIENQIKMIISLFDVDLPILSKNKIKFEELGIKVIVSNLDVLDVCNDKYKTYLFLKENGFLVKNTYINIEDTLNDIHNGIIKYPLIIKPRWGMGSISILEVQNDEELKILYNKVINNIKNSYLKYESKDRIHESVLIQEKINGQEYGLDIINDLNGKYINTVVRKKIAMRSGETDCAIIIDDENLKNIGKKISEKLKHIANMDMDIIIENENVYILELNARFGGGYPFSHISGVNLPYAILEWTKNKKVEREILEPKLFNKYIHKDINIIELNKKEEYNEI